MTKEPKEVTVADAQPFLKWAGGKYSLAPQLHPLMPKDLGQRRYVEPFLGSGGMFFWLRARGFIGMGVLSDRLRGLIKAFKAVRDAPDVLVAMLQTHQEKHNDEYYAARRAQYNAPAPEVKIECELAALFIYLNKTCFNGLYRENARGKFNVPIGSYKNPAICDRSKVYSASLALQSAGLFNDPYNQRVIYDSDFLYLDPPYAPTSATSNFTSYSGVWRPEEQIQLRGWLRELDQRGVPWMLSNSDTPGMRELYADCDIQTVSARRSISEKSSTRGKVNELVIRNLQHWPRGAL